MINTEIMKSAFENTFRGHGYFFSVLQICLKRIMPQLSECSYHMHYEVDVSFANRGKYFPDKYNFTSQSD